MKNSILFGIINGWTIGVGFGAVKEYPDQTLGFILLVTIITSINGMFYAYMEKKDALDSSR